MLSIFAKILSSGGVDEIVYSSVIIPPEGYTLIGTWDEQGDKPYVAFDENGVHNYKYIEGELVKYTDEEKAVEKDTIEINRLNLEYIPSGATSLKEFVLYLISKERQTLTDDMKLKTSGLIEQWKSGKYEIGDIRNYAGQTWECWTAHDNAVYPDITPDNPQTWANFWRPLHGTTKETARPWVKPQNGTTDMYHVGEYMVWTDGTVKKCLRDTVYSPDEYAADWEDAD